MEEKKNLAGPGQRYRDTPQPVPPRSCYSPRLLPYRPWRGQEEVTAEAASPTATGRLPRCTEGRDTSVGEGRSLTTGLQAERPGPSSSRGLGERDTETGLSPRCGGPGPAPGSPPAPPPPARANRPPPGTSAEPSGRPQVSLPPPRQPPSCLRPPGTPRRRLPDTARPGPAEPAPTAAATPLLSARRAPPRPTSSHWPRRRGPRPERPSLPVARQSALPARSAPPAAGPRPLRADLDYSRPLLLLPPALRLVIG